MDLSALLNCGFFPFFFFQASLLRTQLKGVREPVNSGPARAFFFPKKKSKSKTSEETKPKKNTVIPNHVLGKKLPRRESDKKSKKVSEKKKQRDYKARICSLKTKLSFFFLDTGKLWGHRWTFFSFWLRTLLWSVLISHTQKKNCQVGGGTALKKEPDQTVIPASITLSCNSTLAQGGQWQNHYYGACRVNCN